MSLNGIVAVLPGAVGASVAVSGSTVTVYPARLFVVTVMVTCAVGVAPGSPASVKDGVRSVSAIADPTSTLAFVVPVEVSADAGGPTSATPTRAQTAISPAASDGTSVLTWCDGV